MLLQILLLVFITLCQSIKEEEKVELESERRELIAAGGLGIALIAACVSGVVGAVTGAVTTAGINACTGEREKVIIIIQDEKGNYVGQKDGSQRHGPSRRQLVETNEYGVNFIGQETCPDTPDHMVVPLEMDMATRQVAIPKVFFNEDGFKKLSKPEQDSIVEMTPRARWRKAIRTVIDINRKNKEKEAKAAPATAKTDQKPAPPAPQAQTTPKNPTVQVANSMPAEVTSKYNPAAVFLLGCMSSLLIGYFVCGRSSKSKTSELYEEFANDI